jgi:hypothetical protein
MKNIFKTLFLLFAVTIYGQTPSNSNYKATAMPVSTTSSGFKVLMKNNSTNLFNAIESDSLFSNDTLHVPYVGAYKDILIHNHSLTFTNDDGYEITHYPYGSVYKVGQNIAKVFPAEISLEDTLSHKETHIKSDFINFKNQDGIETKIVNDSVSVTGQIWNLPDAGSAGERNLLWRGDLDNVVSVPKNGYVFDGYTNFIDGKAAEEPKFLRLTPTDIIMIYRNSSEYNEVGNEGGIWKVKSTDNGLTWSSPVNIYNDSGYDDRNAIIGKAPNGDIVVVFRKLEESASVTSSIGRIISSDGGATWSAYSSIYSGGENYSPFGDIITRGANICFVASLRVSGTSGYSRASLYESTDNGDTFSATTVLYDIAGGNPAINNPTLGEPYLIDLPNGKSVIFTRNNYNSSNSSSVPVYQFNSDDGYTFGSYQATNIFNDATYPNSSSGFPIIDGDNLIVMAYRRYRSEETSKNYNAVFEIYSQPINSVVANPNKYELQSQIIRPINNSLAISGYPNMIKVEDGHWIGGISDRSLVNTDDTKFSIFLFDYYNLSDYGKNYLELRSKHRFTKLVKNTNTGLADYVSSDVVPEQLTNIDVTPTENSTALITSGGVYDNSVLKANLSGGNVFSGAQNLSDKTASSILATDAYKNIQALTTATYPSLTELTYVKGVTSPIQPQIDGKLAIPTGVGNSASYVRGDGAYASFMASVRATTNSGADLTTPGTITSSTTFLQSIGFLNANLSALTPVVTSPITAATYDLLTTSARFNVSYTGTGDTVWTAPTISNASGVTWYITNMSTIGIITINSNAGANDLFEGVDTNSTVIMPGQSKLISGGNPRIIVQ